MTFSCNNRATVSAAAEKSENGRRETCAKGKKNSFALLLRLIQGRDVDGAYICICQNFNFLVFECCFKVRQVSTTFNTKYSQSFSKTLRNLSQKTFELLMFILFTSSKQPNFRIPNPQYFVYLLDQQQGETLCNLYFEITQPFLILSKSQRSLKMCSQNH